MITVGRPHLKKEAVLSAKMVMFWRMAQALVWMIGFAIFLLLLFYPIVGLLILWNILIPIAPVLLVVATGLWRNICPLATTVLMPRHFNVSKRKKMDPLLQSKLQLVAVIGLYAIVPLRHAIFNTNGLATAILLFLVTLVGVLMGFNYDWKSGWCSSLCPVHPVEKLYGGNTLVALPNAHCDHCVKCTVPCPDTTPNFHPAITKKNMYQTLSGLMIIGGLPGFIWGWFQVPDHIGETNALVFFDAYVYPLIGFLASVMIFILLEGLAKEKNERILISSFAAAGVSIYYWFRIPALLGFGDQHADGLLIDLHNTIPQWIIVLINCATTLFFFYWLVYRKPKLNSWVIRPEYASRAH